MDKFRLAGIEVSGLEGGVMTFKVNLESYMTKDKLIEFLKEFVDEKCECEKCVLTCCRKPFTRIEPKNVEREE